MYPVWATQETGMEFTRRGIEEQPFGVCGDNGIIVDMEPGSVADKGRQCRSLGIRRPEKEGAQMWLQEDSRFISTVRPNDTPLSKAAG